MYLKTCCFSNFAVVYKRKIAKISRKNLNKKRMKMKYNTGWKVPVLFVIGSHGPI